jgi:septum formation protein
MALTIPYNVVEGTSAQLLVSMQDYLGPGNDKIGLLLASQSPRRKEILDMMGLAGLFEAVPSPLDETALQIHLMEQEGGMPDPKNYTRILAEEKAKALAERVAADTTRPTLVLGSDTIVALNNEILEKPQDIQDAKRRLTQLSGNQHTVHTGVALYRVLPPAVSGTVIELVTSFTETANVRFATLSSQDIDAYIATGEPMDKAGSYGIQGIGGQLVAGIEGDFFAVMGLPMHRTSRQLSLAITDIVEVRKR